VSRVVLDRAVLAVALVTAACNGGGGAYVTHPYVDGAPSTCACWDGTSLSALAGCTTSLTVHVRLPTGEKDVSADGHTLEVKLSTIASAAEPAVVLWSTSTVVVGSTASFDWGPLSGVGFSTTRADLVLALEASGLGSVTYAPVVIVDPPVGAAGPYVLCGYWSDGSAEAVIPPGRVTALGTQVSRVALFTGDLSGSFEATMKVVTAEDTSAAYQPSVAAPVSGTTATLEWTVPSSVDTRGFYFETTTIVDGAPFDAAFSGMLAVP
jgi:hypothetical protein